MGIIRNFNTLEDYKLFLKYEKSCSTEVGCGGEGICYLSDSDNQVYKLITKNQLRYCINKIITTSDTDVSQYIFPDELYVVDDQIVGCRTRYIEEKNLFDIKTIDISFFKDDSYFNIDSFLTAYYEILKDTDKLAIEGIAIHDLVLANLLFGGRHFYGIDTMGYTRVNYNPFNSNKRMLDTTIKRGFNFALTKGSCLPNQILSELRTEKDMEKYARKLVKLIKN